jgi:hypothetical protein
MGYGITSCKHALELLTRRFLSVLFPHAVASQLETACEEYFANSDVNDEELRPDSLSIPYKVPFCVVTSWVACCTITIVKPLEQFSVFSPGLSFLPFNTTIFVTNDLVASTEVNRIIINAAENFHRQ